PAIGSRESHSLAQARTETEATRKCGRLENCPPAALDQLDTQVLRPGHAAHLMCQLLACHDAPLQSHSDGFSEVIKFIESNSKVPLPRPCSQITATGGQCSMPQGQFVRRKEVQCPAHGPGLDEGAFLPECPLYGVAFKTLDSRPQSELGGRHKLGVE